MSSRIALLSVALLASACGGGSGYSPPVFSRPGSLQFQAGSFVVDENAGTASITITRIGGSDLAVSVSVASSDGSASAAQDYTAVSTTVNFAAGDAAAKTVSVPIMDDDTPESAETLTLTLSGPGGGATLGATSAATLTIRDNDPPPAPSLATTATIRRLVFTWTGVAGATRYRLLRKLPGAAEFAQVGPDHPATATAATLDIAVHRHDWLNTLYRLDACNANACAASAEIAALPAIIQAIGYFKASNTGVGDSFGWSVALSADGDTLAVGARGESSSATGIDGNQLDDNAPSSGAVYVFARNGTQWSQQAYVKASDTEQNDYFGTSLALSGDGDTLAVGASQEDGIAGAVYVFTRTAGQWSQQQYLKGSNTEAGDEFGSSVALSTDGNTLAVGARGEDSAATNVGGDEADNSVEFSGAVYVFSRAADQWAQQAYVKASNPDIFDAFGFALALSGDGDTLAVSALGEDSNATGIDGNEADNRAPLAGAAYVFTRIAGQWTRQAYVKASNTEMFDDFAFALALSHDGNTLAVSAHGEDSRATGIGGDKADNGAPTAGAAYVFTRTAGQWSQQAYVKASNPEQGDLFGQSLALSADGNTLAVGAIGEDSFAKGIAAQPGDESNNSASLAGAVYVFSRDGDQWSQHACVKASNTQTDDQFGRSVALTADGNMLAVGADGESSNATGVGGDQNSNGADVSGAAYLY
jgi:hypothetical protein